MAAYEVAKEQQYLDETLQKAWQYLSHIAYQTNGINGEIIIELSHLKYENISNKRRRRRRISITAGEESEANVTCGFTAR